MPISSGVKKRDCPSQRWEGEQQQKPKSAVARGAQVVAPPLVAGFPLPACIPASPHDPAILELHRGVINPLPGDQLTSMIQFCEYWPTWVQVLNM